MKENKLHVVFAPYEKCWITRPEYLKVLKKFRAMGAPYKDGLDELVPWILNETDLHLTQNNLSGRVIEYISTMLWVEGVNLADWHKMLLFYIAKNKADKVNKSKASASEANGESEGNSTPLEKEVEKCLGSFAYVSLADDFDPEQANTYTVTMKDGLTFNIYEGAEKKPVGAVRINSETGTFTTAGNIPLGFIKFLRAWLSV